MTTFFKAIGLLAGLLILPGCSVFFDFEKQCESDGDCDGDRCYQNQCITGPIPCASHLDCDQTLELTGTELCVANACQTVIFEEEGGGCRELIGQASVAPENTIILPTIQSLTGVGESFGFANAVNGYRMATQFANDSGSLGQQRVIMVICDDNSVQQTTAKVAERILDATQAKALLGPSGELSQDTILNVALPRKVLTFAATTSLVYSTLVDEDLAFRVYPSGDLAIQGLREIPTRFPPGATIGLMYREDTRLRRIFAETLRVELGEDNITAVAYGINPDDVDDLESVERAAQELAGAHGGQPVDILIMVGLGEMPGALAAYRDALNNGFADSKPRILTDPTGILLIPQLVEVDGAITPFDVEAILGAANPTPAFSALYESTLDTIDGLQLVALSYDSAAIVLLAHAAVPNARSGAELAAALRPRLTAADGDVIDGGEGVRAFGRAAGALASGGSIQYRMVSGGQPLRFDAAGDVPYPIIAGTFLDPEGNTFFPTRIFRDSLWFDACLSAGQACQPKWQGEPEDFDQTCMDIGLERIAMCVPTCDLEMAICPDDALRCVDRDGAGLCVPAPQ